MPEHAGHYPQFYDDNGFDDTQGSDWNYVGSQYLPHPTGIYCHRTTPTGRRDCNGHRASEGLIDRAHGQGAEVYVSIGGWSKSEVFVGLSANAVSRRNFAKNCVGLIREYNFDGIGTLYCFVFLCSIVPFEMRCAHCIALHMLNFLLLASFHSIK